VVRFAGPVADFGDDHDTVAGLQEDMSSARVGGIARDAVGHRDLGVQRRVGLQFEPDTEGRVGKDRRPLRAAGSDLRRHAQGGMKEHRRGIGEVELGVDRIQPDKHGGLLVPEGFLYPGVEQLHAVDLGLGIVDSHERTDETCVGLATQIAEEVKVGTRIRPAGQ
jgi:hypothetical protein